MGLFFILFNKRIIYALFNYDVLTSKPELGSYILISRTKPEYQQVWAKFSFMIVKTEIWNQNVSVTFAMTNICELTCRCHPLQWYPHNIIE